MNLHLDPYFKPITGFEIEFLSFTFAGGEPHIKINSDLKPGACVSVSHRINSFNDLGLLLMAVDALKRMDAILETLYIPYFPAARQDRVMIKGEPLSVKVYADLINQLKFQKVVVLDAHSEVTSALLNHCKVVSNHAFIQQVLTQIEHEPLLISPDGGALKKIYKLSEYLGGMDVVECSKNRDVKTGKLKGFKVYSDNLNGQNCLVVDDICDGGGTFIGLAEELKSKNAGNLFLAITHGIFSKGMDELSKYYSKIFTTDSVQNLDNEAVIQIKIQNGLLSS